MRAPTARLHRALAWLSASCLLAMAIAGAGAAQNAAPSKPGELQSRLAVLPFQVYSAKSLSYLENSLADLLTTRLESSGHALVLDSRLVRESPVLASGERSEASLRNLARSLSADFAIAGSLTELAGRYSLDVRVIARDPDFPTRTMVFTADNDDELLDRVNELSDRVLALIGSGAPSRALVTEVRIEGGSDEMRAGLEGRMRHREGEPYASAKAREDLRALRELPGIATATVETDRTAEGVVVTYHLVPSERLIPNVDLAREQDVVAEIRVQGNKRIEENAIRARMAVREGDPFNPALLASDVREIHALGFFRNVRVFSEESVDGRILVFEVEENPVVRQVSVTGNDNLDSEKIRDNLTLTTGSTLDYPLLFENRERIEALYRAEGYYLADVSYEIEPLQGDAVAIAFDVDENEKLPLDEIDFVGNEHFDDEELASKCKTRPRRWYSFVTKYIDRSGTYSEPVFIQDIRTISDLYSDNGYIQVEIGEPEVRVVKDDKDKDILVVEVLIDEGPQYHVGKVDVAGDKSLDVDALQERLRLKETEVFSRSALSDDVSDLESFYTDRGFFYASVAPQTRLDEADLTVDVTFAVEKGDLHFVREIDISGNTTTVDSVIRREVRLVEGQLQSARAIRASQQRVRRLGFFEDVEFDAKTTDYAEQLDLDVRVVERPTGSLSFGAGFSTQDRFVLSGSLSQSNLFGRGIGASVSIDVGGRSDRFFVQMFYPYFLGSEWYFRPQIFRTDVEFTNFAQKDTTIAFALGRSLDDEGLSRIEFGYRYQSSEVRRIEIETSTSMVWRQRLSEDLTTSLFGVSYITDTRNDRVAPTSGHVYRTNAEVAGLGGFSKFIRLEGAAIWFTRTPDWLPRWFPWRDEATLAFGIRGGWTVPLNEISDYDFTVPTGITSDRGEVRSLDQIDVDLELPLSERYFLGGLGTFQLRGYRARTVGPRRALLRRTGAFFRGPLFTPVGRGDTFISEDGSTFTSFCDDGQVFGTFGGNGNGRCNSIDDQDIDDFDDLEETDVIGGNKFFSASFEYRFPLSEQLGLVGILFLDVGNAFAENENILDIDRWRWGTGFGVLWFSPFGPLQAFVGFPLNKLEVEDSTVFEFSVGGQVF